MSEATIREATSDEDFAAYAVVCRRYTDWCRARYADLAWFVEEVFDHQALDQELGKLRQKYSPPAGRTLLIERGDHVIGGGAYQQLAPGVCELKRVFVTDGARGEGLGRKVTEALLISADTDGFREVWLDTGDRLTAAISLYESLGFKRVAPYQSYPARLLPHLVFMKRTEWRPTE